MTALTEGGNAPIDEPWVRVQIQGSSALDVAGLLLANDGKVRTDADFVFFNQPAAPGLHLEAGSTSTLVVTFAQVPTDIDRIAIVASLDGSGPRDFAAAGPVDVVVLQPGGTPVHTFRPKQLSSESAAVLAEVYRRAGVWKVRAVGQGWASGLAGIATTFGVDVGSAEPPPPPPAAAPAPPPPPPPPPPAPAPAPAPRAAPLPASIQPSAVRLGKVTLDKRGAERRVSLRKDGSSQPFHFNLNWRQNRAVSGLLKRQGNADLDLGCLVEMRDGTKTVIQPLGQNFGSRERSPFIYLDKDDRSGASADGENLYLYRPDLIKRVLVFAMIYEGAPDFQSVAAHLLIRGQDGSETEVVLDSPQSSLKWCAICMVEGTDDGIRLVKEERYFTSARYADEHYHFGFNWTPGRK